MDERDPKSNPTDPNSRRDSADQRDPSGVPSSAQPTSTRSAPRLPPAFDPFVDPPPAPPADPQPVDQPISPPGYAVDPGYHLEPEPAPFRSDQVANRDDPELSAQDEIERGVGTRPAQVGRPARISPEPQVPTISPPEIDRTGPELSIEAQLARELSDIGSAQEFERQSPTNVPPVHNNLPSQTGGAGVVAAEQMPPENPPLENPPLENLPAGSPVQQSPERAAARARIQKPGLFAGLFKRKRKQTPSQPETVAPAADAPAAVDPAAVENLAASSESFDAETAQSRLDRDLAAAEQLLSQTAPAPGEPPSDGGGSDLPPKRASKRAPKSSRSWGRRLGFTGAGIVALFVLIIFVLPFLLPSQTISREVSRQVQQATGWHLAIDGPIRVGLLPLPRLSLSDVAISAGDGRPNLVNVGTVRFGINFGAIFTGNVRLNEVAFVNPKIDLLVDENGRATWRNEVDPITLSQQGAQPENEEIVNDTGSALAALERLQIDDISIQGGELTYQDLRSEDVYKIEDLSLSTSLNSLDEPLKVLGGLEFRDQRFEVTSQLDVPRAAITRQRSPVEVVFENKLATASIGGIIDFGLGPAFGGQVGLNVSSISSVGSWFGADFLDDRESQKGALVSVELSASPDAINVANFTLRSGDEMVQGEADINFGQSLPTLSGEIVSEGLSLQAISSAIGVTGPSWPEFDGTLIVDVQFAALGNNLDEIASSLNARGTLGVRAGSIRNTGLGLALGEDEADNISGVVANITINTLDTPIGLIGQADWRGERFDITGQFAAGQMLVNGLAPTQFGVRSNRLNGRIDGTFAQTGEFDGDITIETVSLRGLLNWLNQPLQEGKGFGPFSYRGQMSLAPGAVSFSNAQISLDQSRGVGRGVLDYSSDLTLDAELELDTLDLTPYLSGSDPSTGANQPSSGSLPGIDTGPSNGGWSTSEIDFSPLNAANANLRLTANEIVLDKVRTGRTSMNVLLDKGMFSADLTEMQLYGGRGAGRMTVDASSAPAAVNVNFDLQSLNALPFLNDAIGLNRIEGLADFAINLSTSGTSEFSLVSALKGATRLLFRDGALRGINIPSMVRTLSARTLVGWQTSEAQKTDFSEFSGSFEISNGLARTRDIRLVGPLVRATGAGTVDLPAKTLDMRFDPKVVASLQGQGGQQDLAGLGVPIVVDGSFDQPRIYPDIAGILENPDAAFDQLRQFGGNISALTDDGDALRDAVRERTGVDLTSVVQDGRIDRDAAIDQGANLIGRLIGGENNTNATTIEQLLGNDAQPQTQLQSAGGIPIPTPDPRGSLARPLVPNNAAPRFMTPEEVRRVTGGQAVVNAPNSAPATAPSAPNSPSAVAPSNTGRAGPIDLLSPGGASSPNVQPGSGNPQGPSGNPVEGLLRGLFGR